MLTSNHNFVNLLTIALCLFLLDDRAVAFIRSPFKAVAQVPVSGALKPLWSRVPLLLMALVLFLVSFNNAAQYLLDRQWQVGQSLSHALGRYGLGNIFHIFPNMQTERHELVIEGSHDGRQWQVYDFHYKSDFPGDRPRLAMPLHPRLDWLMWFVPAQHPQMRTWFEGLMIRLQQNEPAVTALLRKNPFADEPPRYLRVLSYRYRFSSPKEYRNSGHYWQVELLGEFPNVRPRVP